MAQLEAARAQQAAEAACIGLTLDEEKITSLSASTRRQLQGLALVVQVCLKTHSLGVLMRHQSEMSKICLLTGCKHWPHPW